MKNVHSISMSQPHVHEDNKQLKISPGAYIFQRLFLRGLFLEGLIYGGILIGLAL